MVNKKDKFIILRVSSSDYDDFKKYCKSINITSSFLLRMYITSCIVKYQLADKQE